VLSLAFRRLLLPRLAIVLAVLKLDGLRLRLILLGLALFALAYSAETKAIIRLESSQGLFEDPQSTYNHIPVRQKPSAATVASRFVRPTEIAGQKSRRVGRGCALYRQVLEARPPKKLNGLLIENPEIGKDV
jgi:hypothetical protein